MSKFLLALVLTGCAPALNATCADKLVISLDNHPSLPSPPAAKITMQCDGKPLPIVILAGSITKAAN